MPGLMKRNERVADLIEQAGREEAEFIAVRLRRFPQIIARPHEFIALGDNDPGARIIKTEMFFDRQRNFNRRPGVNRRGMRDGQDGDDCRVIALARYAEDNDAWAVLAALFESGAMFVMREVMRN